MLEFLKLCESRAEAYSQYQKYYRYYQQTTTSRKPDDAFTKKVRELAIKVKQLDQQIYIKKYYI